MRSAALSLILACMVAACRSVGGPSTMYPESIQAGAAVKGDSAVVLVGNGGDQAIDYLQFVHSGFPAINARGISLAPDGIVAIPVPVGTTGLQLSNYTSVGRPGTYLPNGMSSGFVRVNTPGIDIRSPGLYYVATIFPGQPRNFELKPTAAQLIKLRKDRPELADLKPANFNWSN